MGNLRSPHFKIEYDQILVRAKANNGFMRIVIDHYHMGKHSGLLFGGTVIKEANSEDNFRGSVYRLKNTKAIGPILSLLIGEQMLT